MKLLLHMCCGPCACYPVKKLRADGIEPVGYFFNPNIHPYQEWKRRLNTAREFADKQEMEFFAHAHYQLRDFLKKALPAEAEPNGRCRMCYTWRLGEAARFAAEHGFDAFTSTLFYSIYQQHDLMAETARKFAAQYGIQFYYEDFRVGWQEGIDISVEKGLFRQGYCGCIFSEEERYSKELRKEKKKWGKEMKRRRLAKMENADSAAGVAAL